MHGIAIDLGAAYSRAARVNDQGIPRLIPDADQPEQLRTPSLIHLGVDGALVGQAAKVASYAQPDEPTIGDFKSMIASGRTLAVDQARKGWTAEACTALLLSKLRQDAVADRLDAVDEVVLTVPSHFTRAQRHALSEVAQETGLRVRGIVDECVAAAYYASANGTAEQTVLVLQAGRCGFEVAIVRCSRQGATILAGRHDGSLGGKAVDKKLAEAICSTQGWTWESLSRPAIRELLNFAEQLKTDLSQSETGQVHRQGIVGTATLEFVLTRWHLDQLISPLLERAFELIESCLGVAQLDWTKLDRVVLAGGTMQLPALRTEVMRRCGLPADRISDKDPDTAVAYGAAQLAALPDAQLARFQFARPAEDSVSAAELTRPDRAPVAQFDFGIRIGDPRTGQAAIYKLIKRGTPLPAAANKQFRTARADQSRLVIEVSKSAGPIRSAESLGHLSLSLPAGLPANHPITVTMHSDAAGQVRVEAESEP